MDPFTLIPLDVDTPRYLPAYDETIVSYSLRLPTYRSSYIRRFHPYARYITSAIENYEDGSQYDNDEEPLDFSILVQRVEVLRNDLHAAIGPSDRARELPEINETQADNVNPGLNENTQREEELEKDEENL